MFICKSLVRDPRNKIVDVDLIQPSWFTEATDAEGLKKYLNILMTETI